MPDGSIFKRCGCRHPDTGKPFGNDCPKLRRPNRAWSSEHGHWAYQIELPPTTDGRRRQLRRAGLPNRRAAADELDQARELLALAGGDRRRRTEVADVLQAAVRAKRPLPEVDRLRQRLRGDGPLADMATLAEYLAGWLEHLNIDANTIGGYASIVRVHLIPHLGEVPLDKLRTSHIREMFAAIGRRNDEILAARTSPDPAVRQSVAGCAPPAPRVVSASAPACARPSTTPSPTNSSSAPTLPRWSKPRPTGRCQSCGRTNACNAGRTPARSPDR
ncbi:tyrosine-type recombinase/integrase [Micromonospora tarensis]|uniref:hypothetical protein n=1 Tax=Micromonospora tarensis TaxID=2806100 RepID=UPI001EE3F066|nr:hypothetical protein [Micromonospora tarensis]